MIERRIRKRLNELLAVLYPDTHASVIAAAVYRLWLAMGVHGLSAINYWYVYSTITCAAHELIGTAADRDHFPTTKEWRADILRRVSMLLAFWDERDFKNDTWRQIRECLANNFQWWISYRFSTPIVPTDKEVQS